jgi:hypothetical protein
MAIRKVQGFQTELSFCGCLVRVYAWVPRYDAGAVFNLPKEET